MRCARSASGGGSGTCRCILTAAPFSRPFMSDSRLSDPACEQPLVFVDLETTGGSSAEHRITEIGVVEIGPQGVST